MIDEQIERIDHHKRALVDLIGKLPAARKEHRARVICLDRLRRQKLPCLVQSAVFQAGVIPFCFGADLRGMAENVFMYVVDIGKKIGVGITEFFRTESRLPRIVPCQGQRKRLFGSCGDAENERRYVGQCPAVIRPPEQRIQLISARLKDIFCLFGRKAVAVVRIDADHTVAVEKFLSVNRRNGKNCIDAFVVIAVVDGNFRQQTRHDILADLLGA